MDEYLPTSFEDEHWAPMAINFYYENLEIIL